MMNRRPLRPTPEKWIAVPVDERDVYAVYAFISERWAQRQAVLAKARGEGASDGGRSEEGVKA